MAYSGRLGLKIPNTSPFFRPFFASPAASERTLRSSWEKVMVRPLGPSISAGRSPRLAALARVTALSGPSGIVTSAWGLFRTMLVSSSQSVR